MSRPPVYSGGRRGNKSRPHARLATASPCLAEVVAILAWGRELLPRRAPGYTGSVQLLNTTILHSDWWGFGVAGKTLVIPRACQLLDKRSACTPFFMTPVFCGRRSLFCLLWKPKYEKKTGLLQIIAVFSQIFRRLSQFSA